LRDYMEATSQVNAIMSDFNSALSRLEEVKGTLLEQELVEVDGDGTNQLPPDLPRPQIEMPESTLPVPNGLPVPPPSNEAPPAVPTQEPAKTDSTRMQPRLEGPAAPQAAAAQQSKKESGPVNSPYANLRRSEPNSPAPVASAAPSLPQQAVAPTPMPPQQAAVPTPTAPQQIVVPVPSPQQQVVVPEATAPEQIVAPAPTLNSGEPDAPSIGTKAVDRFNNSRALVGKKLQGFRANVHWPKPEVRLPAFVQPEPSEVAKRNQSPTTDSQANNAGENGATPAARPAERRHGLAMLSRRPPLQPTPTLRIPDLADGIPTPAPDVPSRNDQIASEGSTTQFNRGSARPTQTEPWQPMEPMDTVSLSAPARSEMPSQIRIASAPPTRSGAGILLPESMQPQPALNGDNQRSNAARTVQSEDIVVTDQSSLQLPDAFTPEARPTSATGSRAPALVNATNAQGYVRRAPAEGIRLPESMVPSVEETAARTMWQAPVRR
jgi:hypothetical protein